MAIMQMILRPVSHANSRIRTLEHLSVKQVHSLVNSLRDYTQTVNRLKVSSLVTSTALLQISQMSRPHYPLPCRMAASQLLLCTLLPLRNSHRKRILENTLPILSSAARDCTLLSNLSSRRTFLVLVIETFGEFFLVLDGHFP